jgi:type II secretory pathway pseudopilin PulG
MRTRINSGPPHGTSASDREAGFMLVYVVLLAALMLIALAAAAPVIAKELRRDKEVESAHRANQYVRAIRLYYLKNKTYPPSIDALENTNNVRFLRKRYVDPLTGKADWRIIHVGENKTTVKGFFGQPLGGLNSSGAGAGLGSASTLGTGFGGASSPTTGPTTVSGGSALSAGFSGATIGGSTTTGSSTSGNSIFGSNSGTGGSTTGSSTGGTSTTSDSTGAGGIGQIMGVGSAKTGDSIMNPNEQTTYETWEFLYDPKIELLYQQANILGGGAGGTVNSQSPSSLGTTPGAGQSNTPGGSNTSTPTTPQPTSPYSSH